MQKTFLRFQTEFIKVERLSKHSLSPGDKARFCLQCRASLIFNYCQIEGDFEEVIHLA